jgi:hypothetical protein
MMAMPLDIGPIEENHVSGFHPILFGIEGPLRDAVEART